MGFRGKHEISGTINELLGDSEVLQEVSVKFLGSKEGFRRPQKSQGIHCELQRIAGSFQAVKDVSGAFHGCFMRESRNLRGISKES